MRDKHLIIWLSAMSGVSSLTGASIFGDIFPPKIGAGILAIVGALNAATATYVAWTRPVYRAVRSHEDRYQPIGPRRY